MELPIRVVITDIDGVWTDGRIYLNEEGRSVKAFHTTDSVGASLLRIAGIPLIVITGETSEIAKNRAKELKVDYVFTGVRNKLLVATTILKDLGFTLAESAYIGDDLADLPLLEAVGFSAVPADAGKRMKTRQVVTLGHRGGEGAFREFSELILSRNGILEKTTEEFLRILSEKNY